MTARNDRQTATSRSTTCRFIMAGRRNGKGPGRLSRGGGYRYTGLIPNTCVVPLAAPNRFGSGILDLPARSKCRASALSGCRAACCGAHSPDAVWPVAARTLRMPLRHVAAGARILRMPCGASLVGLSTRVCGDLGGRPWRGLMPVVAPPLCYWIGESLTDGGLRFRQGGTGVSAVVDAAGWC